MTNLNETTVDADADKYIDRRFAVHLGKHGEIVTLPLLYLGDDKTMDTEQIDPWQLPAVAQAQRALVESQLADETKCAPFQAFLRAMRKILELAPALETGTLLDVGCGVGHYGVLLARHYPRMNYVGTDSSIEMVNAAVSFQASHEAIGILSAGDFSDAPFEYHPLILVSQVMDVMPDPRAALTLVLARIRPGAYLILHRMRWTLEPSHAIEEKTYLDYDARNFMWNGQEVLRACMAVGEVLDVDVWDDCTTLIVRKT